MKERWKNIKDYEGFYQVSNFGRVRSMDRFVKDKNGIRRYVEGSIIKQVEVPFGYPWVQLRKNGKRCTKLVHKLVAEAFLPNPNNYPIINHKDENKANANVTNLEWCSYTYNSTYNNIQNRRNFSNIIKPVNQYDKDMNLIKQWNSISEAARFYNIPPTNISRCCKGKTKTCHKFIWIYCSELLNQRQNGKNKQKDIH